MSEKTGRWEIAARISSGLPRIVVVVVPGGADAEAFSQNCGLISGSFRTPWSMT